MKNKRLFLLVLCPFWFCPHTFGQKSTNALLPNELLIQYRVDISNPDTLAGNKSNAKETDLTELLFNPILSGKVTVYDPTFFGSMYSVKLPEKIDTTEVREKLGGGTFIRMVEDVETGQLIEIKFRMDVNLEEIKSLLFTEAWVFDEQNFRMGKSVRALEPVRHFYREEDVEQQEVMLKKVCRLIYPQSISKGDMRKIRKRMVSVKKAEYELYLNQAEADALKYNPEYIKSMLQDAGLQIENYNAPYFSSISREKFIDMLFQRVMSGKSAAYWYPDGKSKTLEEIKIDMGAINDSIMVEDFETGNLVFKVVQGEMQLSEIKSVIFIEDWSIDPVTLYMEKKVLGIAPVRHYFTGDNFAIPMKKIPFVVYF